MRTVCISYNSIYVNDHSIFTVSVFATQLRNIYPANRAFTVRVCHTPTHAENCTSPCCIHKPCYIWTVTSHTARALLCACVRACVRACVEEVLGGRRISCRTLNTFCLSFLSAPQEYFIKWCNLNICNFVRCVWVYVRNSAYGLCYL